jgi:phospholipid transport system substrate-binding protein
MKRMTEAWGCAAIVAVAVGLGTAQAEPVLATATPEATVATLHRGLIDLALKQPTATPEERYRVLAPLVTATHDLPYIAQFALRRQWPALSEEARTRFATAFERLSVMTYAVRFAAVGADTFKITGVAPTEAQRAQVTAAIVRPGAADLPLEYLLQQDEGAWRIINIVADGVSDLALKRAEYQRLLAAGSIDTLIAHLDEQTARLERN